MRRFLAMFLAVLSFSAWGRLTRARAEAKPIVRSGSAMGTTVQISVLSEAEREDKARAALDAAFAEIARLEAMMTTWREDSEISRVNQNAGGAPVKVSRETMAVLKMAQQASRWSGGAFDVTFYAMRGLWKFDEDLEAKIPAAEEIRARLANIDYRKLVLDEEKSTALLKQKGMGISLGGIAKGYAVDRAAAILKKAGFGNALVQAGGDLLCAGTKNGKPWTAGIRDPRGGPTDIFAVMQLSDHAFSTAGDYERFFMLDGRRYHHILDPKTGAPAMRSRSVTIYAPTALIADAIDDAVFILGWKKGFEMIAKIPDVGAVVVDENNEVHISPRVKAKVRTIHPPTDGI